MQITRREFHQTAAAALATAGAFRANAARPFAGIQAGAISFLDEGVEPVLDNMQKRAGCNALFIATFTYGRGIAGRQVPGAPFPDHGKQEEDRDFRGGFYIRPRPEFYKESAFQPEHASEIPSGFDVLDTVLPAAHQRRMKVFCWYEDVFRSDRPGFSEMAEVDLHGRLRGQPCLRNPNTRAFWLGQIENYLREYEVDGLMFGSERQGPLGNALGASHGGAGNDPGKVGCFCNYCRSAAKQMGIHAERAVAGYGELEKLVVALRHGARPADGAFVSFWRLLVDYPDILAWERLWNEGLRELYRAQYARAHELRPSIAIGWHIWHNNTFSPFYRAEQDYAELGKTADFFKVVMYNNCAGPRMASFIRSVAGSVFADLPPEQVLQLIYGVQQFGERPLSEISAAGFSADYVYRETRRAMATTRPQTAVWPGIDIDIPTGKHEKRTTPPDVSGAVAAALNAGAPGVILSRKYSEMKLANLDAAGRALGSA